MLRTAKRSSKNAEIEKCHPVIVSADHSTTTRSRSAEMGEYVAASIACTVSGCCCINKGARVQGLLLPGVGRCFRRGLEPQTIQASGSKRSGANPVSAYFQMAP